MKNKAAFIHLICLLLSLVISAQISFIEDTSQSFEGAANGSLAFADIDNDGDQDLLTTGFNADFDTLTVLYKNDGLGNFTKVTDTPFEHMCHGDTNFGDVDNDGDEDLIIAGVNTLGTSSTKLFINDGAGNFTEVENTSFEPLLYGKLALADLDSDGDKDLIVLGGVDDSGGVGFVIYVSKIYFNDGLGNFLPAVTDDLSTYGSFDLADVDGDKDLDILISGATLSSSDQTATLYINDGSGGFTEKLNTPFLGVSLSTVNFADMDGDADMDVLITGLNGSLWPSSKIYINDGEGNFTEDFGSQLSVFSGACGFADIDLDQDQDMLITGEIFAYMGPAVMFYSNDGNGDFSEVSDFPFIGLKSGFLEFVDIDGDADQDLFITGFDSTNISQARLYINDFTISSIEPSLTFSPNIFPNPFDEYFKLNFEYNSSKNTIELFNILGQIMLTKQTSFPSSEIEISTTHLQSGLYFLKVKNEKEESKTISIYKN